jgi:hypothetical protein
MVGGMVLARAMGDEDSGAILDACRRFLHRATDARLDDARAELRPGAREAAARPGRGGGA